MRRGLGPVARLAAEVALRAEVALGAATRLRRARTRVRETFLRLRERGAVFADRGTSDLTRTRPPRRGSQPASRRESARADVPRAPSARARRGCWDTRRPRAPAGAPPG